MKYSVTKFVLSSLVFSGFATTAAAAFTSDGDWPQWRGPRLDGISSETDWVAAGRPLWQKDLGLGYSTISIQDGRLYTMGYDKEASEDVVFCLDAETGEELWRHTYGADIWAQFHGGGTLTTPTVDGERVYTVNREGRFFALSASDGEVLAERLLFDEFGLEHPTWGFSGSPLALDDMLVLNLGRVIALDKESLETLWSTEENFGHAYSTPAVFEIDGRTCLAVFNGVGLVVLDRSDGSHVATHEWKTRYDVNAATPIVVQDKIFISSGYNHGCALLELNDGGLEVVWENKEMRNQMSGSVLIGQHLYGFDETELKCLGLDGETKWTQRGFGKGALIGAGERLVLMSEKGELVVAEANPDEFVELSREKVLDGGVYWTTPVLAGGRIYCRNSVGGFVARDHRPLATQGGE